MILKNRNFIFSSESVTEGHPDKVADQISDAILDDMIAGDSSSRVAVETLVTTGICFISGEVSTKTYSDIFSIAKRVIKRIGYTKEEYGFSDATVGILTSIKNQSSDIAMGVNTSSDHEQGAGDQGMMFGYATIETDDLMPMPINLAHKLTKRLAYVRKEKADLIPYLRPDGKSQVSVRYEAGVPKEITAVVISTQTDDIDLEQVRNDVREHIIKPVIPEDMWAKDIKIYINPTGRFILGGPVADTGLTGRKIIVDTYGGVGSHGGGAFSGKDPSKVDRSASYMARYIAKNVVASTLADVCEVQIAYAIGVADPVSFMLNTYGTEKVDREKLEKTVREMFPLKPTQIIKHLDLLRPIYINTAAYGHFGRVEKQRQVNFNNKSFEGFTWERTDLADKLKTALNG
ncbi:methionine adenosyltransferase [bacterium]|nr:methionine adenosyltransferase [bacterium]